MCGLLANSQSGKTAGNTTLKKQATMTLQKSEPGDTLFIAFDNVDSTDTFCVADFINGLISVCKHKHVKLVYTKYYCFEELYLGYNGLENMCRRYIKDSMLLNVLEYVSNCIHENKNYYDINEGCIQYMISCATSAEKNREHFASALLTKVTRELMGYFTISKKEKSFGKCWYVDCLRLKQNNSDKHILFFCNQCAYRCKDSKSADKLRDVIQCNSDVEILQLLQLCKFDDKKLVDLKRIEHFSKHL